MMKRKNNIEHKRHESKMQKFHPINKIETITNEINEISNALATDKLIQQNQLKVEELKRRVESLRSQKTILEEADQQIIPVSFNVLPVDTILFILQFNELQLERYIFQFNRNNSDKDLIKLLFGYFGDDNNRIIITLSTRVSLPFLDAFDNDNDLANFCVYVISLLIRAKTLRSLKLYRWLDSKVFHAKLPILLRNFEMNFDHIELLLLDGNMCSSNSVGDVFINRCTGLTYLKSVGTINDFSQFIKLKELIYCDREKSKYPPVLTFCTPLQLRKLNVSGVIAPDVMNQIALLPHLTHLQASLNGTINLNPNLKHLVVSNFRIAPTTIINIMKLQNLNTLEISCPDNLTIIPYFETNTTITDLTVHFNNSNKGMLIPFINSLVNNRSIKCLTIWNTTIAIQKLLESQQFLQQLVTCLLESDNNSISPLMHTAVNLTKLKLWATVITDESLDAIIQHPKLQELYLTTSLTEQQLIQLFMNSKVHKLTLEAHFPLNINTIKYLQWNYHLHTLELQEMELSKQIVIELLKLRSLRSLDIACIDTCDTDVIPYLQLSNLETLIVCGITVTNPVYLYQAAAHIPNFSVLN
jgi:hypothetical protein